MWEIGAPVENMGTVQDGMNTLSKPHTIVDLPDARPLVRAPAAKSILITSISLTKRASPCSTASTCTIRPGEKVGLIGRSGAGKSTIVNLLLRFYETNSGSISIDSRNIRNVTQESLRKQIGLVTQDASLLHRSVRDNLSMAALMPAMKICMRAAEQRRSGRVYSQSFRCQRPARLRCAGGRARREAFRRPAPAHRHCPA